jgi:sialidase-1
VVDENTGDILVFTEEQHPPAPLHVFRSTDHGKTWTRQEVVIHPDEKGNVPSMCMNERGITLRHGEHAGRLLRPTRSYGRRQRPQYWPQHYTNAIYSDDGGKTWHTSAPFPALGTGEATLAELSDGRIYYNSRRHLSTDGLNPRRRHIAHSDDGGADLEGPVRQRRAARRRPGPRLRPDGRPGPPAGPRARHPGVQQHRVAQGRHNGTVWASFDGGKTWPVKRLVEKGSFAYSSLAAGRPARRAKAGSTCCTKAAGGGRIARFNLAWLLEGEPTGDGSNVVWDSPSENSLGSMPLGNGDIGANVWVEPSATSSCCCPRPMPLTTSRACSRSGGCASRPSPRWCSPTALPTALNLRDGCIDIESGETTVRVWIDANHPVVQVDFQSKTPFTAEAVVEIWRTEVRMLDRKQGREIESHSTYGNFPEKLKVNPDVVLPHDESSIAWCHHNIESQWERNMRHTGLEAEIPKHTDPILRRTFGAVIRGSGMKPASDLVLKARNRRPPGASKSPAHPVRGFARRMAQGRQRACRPNPADSAARFAAHRAWWQLLGAELDFHQRRRCERHGGDGQRASLARRG